MFDIDTVKVSAVGITGSGYSFLGLPFGEWVAILTCVYILIKIALELPTLWRKFRGFFKWE